MPVHTFTFSDFQENTYLLEADNKECAIVDPGCYYEGEQNQLKLHIEQHGLKPVKLLNTHCHLDHVFGNKFVADTYQLEVESHKGEAVVLQAVPLVCQAYGIRGYQESPAITKFLNEGDKVCFGNIELEVLFVPGHSPAHIAFYNKKEGYIIGGDVLFYQSIGRTDLPGGNHQTLLSSIKSKFWPLPNDTVVYPGHGPSTTIGFEKQHNPFLNN